MVSLNKDKNITHHLQAADGVLQIGTVLMPSQNWPQGAADAQQTSTVLTAAVVTKRAKTRIPRPQAVDRCHFIPTSLPHHPLAAVAANPPGKTALPT